jgi:hypothetical protein
LVQELAIRLPPAKRDPMALLRHDDRSKVLAA